MTLTLYCTDVSPAVRSTLLTIKALGLNVDLKEVNLAAGEHLSADFLKKNPFHTVPTLEDGDFTIWDSHAINAYLVDKYAKDDTFYPKDLQKRAVINQRLIFDASTLFPRMGAIVASLLREGAKSVNKDKADSVTQAYTQLETLLERSTYVAGEELSIADFSIIATITSANALVPIASNRFPKITDYITKMRNLPYYKEGNQVGLEKFIGFMKSKLA